MMLIYIINYYRITYMALIKKIETLKLMFNDPAMATIKIEQKKTPKTWGEAKYLFDNANGNLNIDPDYYKTIAWDEWDTFSKELKFDDEMWMFILDSDNNYMNLMQGFVITRNKIPTCVFNITSED